MQTELLKVTGMTCGGCSSNVTQALKNVSGVSAVNVSLPNGEASVQYDEHLTTAEQLKAAVKAAGYGVDSPSTTPKSQSKCCCG